MKPLWEAPDGGNIIAMEVIDEDSASLYVETDKGNSYILDLSTILDSD